MTNDSKMQCARHYAYEMMEETRADIKPRQSSLWRLWRVFFPGLDLNTAIITVGRTISVPPTYTAKSFFDTHPDKVAHECVHVKQQEGPRWYPYWCIVKYFFSKRYRYQCELGARAYEFSLIKECKLGDSARVIESLVDAMAHPMYGFSLSARHRDIVRSDLEKIIVDIYLLEMQERYTPYERRNT